ATNASNRIRLKRAVDPNQLKAAVTKQADSEDWDDDESTHAGAADDQDDMDMGNVDLDGGDSTGEHDADDSSSEIDLGGLSSLDGDDVAESADLGLANEDSAGTVDEDLSGDIGGNLEAGDEAMDIEGDAELADMAGDDELFGAAEPG